MTDEDGREEPGDDAPAEDESDGDTALDEVGGPRDEASDPTTDDDSARPEQAGTAGENTFGEGGVDDNAPLSSLAESVDRRRDRDQDGDPPDDQLFSEESVEEIDPDVVWERLKDERPELPDQGERDVRVIEKRSYCEQCPFFSAPPEVGCTHEETEILELVDMDHFRVVDCPKVVENERLERL